MLHMKSNTDAAGRCSDSTPTPAKKGPKKNVLKVFAGSVVSKTWSWQELDGIARDKNKKKIKKNKNQKIRSRKEFRLKKSSEKKVEIEIQSE